MKLTEKQEKKLVELVEHMMGVCECDCMDKTCLFNKLIERDAEGQVALIVKEIKKL